MEFIEIHEKKTNRKVLVPLNCILSISQCHNDLTAFVETHVDSDGNSLGIYTKELYAEIKFQILKLSQKAVV